MVVLAAMYIGDINFLSFYLFILSCDMDYLYLKKKKGSILKEGYYDIILSFNSWKDKESFIVIETHIFALLSWFEFPSLWSL